LDEVEDKPTTTPNPAEPRVETIAGFDDKTDKAVGKPTIEQANESSDITITPKAAEDSDGDNSNNENNADANKVAVKFDASHLTPSTAKALGLKVNVEQNGTNAGTEKVANDQFIVALRADGKWTLHLVNATNLDEALKKEYLIGESSAVPEAVATIDPKTGAITLKKEVVNGAGGEANGPSIVEAKAQDPYGNQETAENWTVKHSDPSAPLVVADIPHITDLGGGKATITLGNNNNGMEVTIGDKTYTVKNDPAKGEYTISPAVTTGVEFDPITGRITVTSTTPTTIKAKGKVDDTLSEERIVSIDPTTDPTPDSTDPAGLAPLVNGDVEVKPGADNKTIRIKYTDNNGITQNVELVKGSDGNWTPSTRAEDFTVANGKITLKASAVKDMTEVTAIGNNGKQDQQEPASAYPFVDDNSLDAADKPWLHPSDNNMLIEKGADNHRVDVAFTPKGKAGTQETITAKLVEGGYWVLTDKDGVPVDPDVAEINPDDGTITLKGGAVEPSTSITATGHNLQTTAQGVYTPDNNRPADTASGTTEAPLPDQPQEKPKETGPKIIGDNGDGIYIKSISDSTFEIVTLPKTFYDQNRILVGFKVYDTVEHMVKDAVIELNKLGDYKLTVGGVIAGNRVSGGEVVERENGSRKKTFSGSNDGRYKLVADSPLEPDLKDIEHPNLKAIIRSYASDGETLLKNETKNEGYLKNEVSNNPQISNETQDKEKSAQPALEKAVGTEKGGIIIKPASDADYLSVQYVDENGRTKYASLTKANGSWKLVGDRNDFDLSDPNNLKLKADSLRDNQQNGVSVKQRQEGKALSEAQVITPEVDYVLPAQQQPVSASSAFENIKNKAQHTSQVNRLSTGRPATMKAMKEFTKNEGGDVKEEGFLWLKKTYTLTDEAQGVHINGALNYGSLIPITINMQGGNDSLIVENQVAQSIINLGDGNDILGAGIANPKAILYEDTSKTNPLDRYQFLVKDDRGNSVAGLPQPNGNPIQGFSNEHGSNGGNIIDATVNGGKGNDIVLVGGSNNILINNGNYAAITKGSTVDLGDGDDALIIAPLYKGRLGNIEGNVNMGNGNDKLSAPEIADGAKVYMGNGNDEVRLNRMSGGELDLGSGDDRIEFTPFGDRTFIDGKINGGAGYDTFVLRKPSADNGELVTAVFASKPETYLSVSKLISIEEVRMEKGTAIDISTVALRRGNMPVLKLLAEGDKSAGSVGGKDARLVDLGANNLNNDTNQKLGEFKDIGTKEEGGVTYKVYSAPGTQVWIEDNAGFTII
ncbi:hypothetical protein ACWIUH_11040, partial [Ursidibacter arcticus]